MYKRPVCHCSYRIWYILVLLFTREKCISSAREVIFFLFLRIIRLKYHRSTCTDASPSYVSRIFVGKCSRVFSLHGTWFKTTILRKRPRCKFTCKNRENLNWDNLFFTRFCFIIKMNIDSPTGLRKDQSLSTI